MLRDAAVSPARSPGVGAPLYSLGPARSLPSFDPRRTVKLLLLSGRTLKTYNLIVRRIQTLLFPAYWIGFLLRVVVFFAPRLVGPVAPVLSVMLQLPLVVNTSMGMRIELMKVLMGTFDFWFFSTMVTIWSVTMGFAMGPRIQLVMLPGMWFEVMNAMMLEASHQVRANGLATLIASTTVVFLLALMVAVSLGRIAGFRCLTIAITATHSITTDGVLLNTMSTMVMFNVRLAYVYARKLLKSRVRTPRNPIRSLLFQCAMRWQPVHQSPNGVLIGPAIPCPSSVNKTASVRGEQVSMSMVASTTEFEGANILIPWIAPPSTQCARMFRQTAALTSFGAIVSNLGTRTPDNFSDVTAAIAVVSTIIYATMIVPCYQRQILQRICTSFNFAFLSIQLSAAHICLCDVFYWQRPKTIVIATSWIWMHVVITADALTPVMKERLRYKLAFMAPAVAIGLVSQVLLMLELTWWNHWHLQNRVIWEVQVLSGHHVSINAASLLLSRLMTLEVWFVRLLYRVWRRSSEDELVLLQGQVEFDYMTRKRVRLKDHSTNH